VGLQLPQRARRTALAVMLGFSLLMLGACSEETREQGRKFAMPANSPGTEQAVHIADLWKWAWIAALITGAENPSARSFALREHFHAVYFGSRNKTVAIEALCRTQRVSSDRLICVFDDVNDLGMAFACGIRVFVQRTASPLLREYVVRQGLCDYVTAHPSERHAVREVCELLLGLLGSFEAVVASRVAWDTSYAEYFAKRQALATEFIDQRVND